jgi:hypothetical protein
LGVVYVRGGKDLDGATFVDAASDSTLKELIAAVKGVAPKIDEAVDTKTDGIVNPVKQGAGALKDAAKKGANTIMDLARDFSRGGVTTSQLTEALGGLVDPTGLATRAMTGMFEYGEQSNQVLKDLSQTGMTFGGSIEELRQQAAGTRLSFQEFQQVMRINQEQIAMMGATGKDAARNFTSFSKQFMDSPFAGELLNMGYNFEEINGMLATYGAITAGSNRERLGADSKQVEAAMALSKEMDAISKLTGKNREELQKEMAGRARNGQVQAFLMGQNADSAAAFQASMSSMGATLGKDFEKLAQDMIIRGFPAKDMAAMAGLYGDAVNKMAEAKVAYEKGDMTGYTRLMNEAQAEAMKFQKSQEGRQLAMLGDASQVTQMVVNNGTAMSVSLARMQEAAKKYPELAGDEVALRKKVLEDIAEQQKQEAAGGDKTTAALNKLDQASRDASLALTKELIVPLSQTVGPALLKAGEAFGAMTSENVARAKSELGAIDKIVNDAKNKIEAPVATPTKPTTTAPAKPEATTPSTGQKPFDYIPGAKPISREFGSLGMTGKLFEDFGEGTVAMLHGKETVMTPGQLSGLISKATARPMAVPEGMESLVAGMDSKMQTMAQKMEAASLKMIGDMPRPDTSMMFDPKVMTDIAGTLEKLNMTMTQVAENTAEQVGASKKQIRATQGLSGDLFKGM